MRIRKTMVRGVLSLILLLFLCSSSVSAGFIYLTEDFNDDPLGSLLTADNENWIDYYSDMNGIMEIVNGDTSKVVQLKDSAGVGQLAGMIIDDDYNINYESTRFSFNMSSNIGTGANYDLRDYSGDSVLRLLMYHDISAVIVGNNVAATDYVVTIENTEECFNITVASDCDITSVTAYLTVTSAAHNAKCAIYSGDGTAVLGVTNEVSVPVQSATWTNFPFADRVHLQAGNYMLAIDGQAYGGNFQLNMKDNADSYNSTYQTTSYASFPRVPWTYASEDTGRDACIYASGDNGYKLFSWTNSSVVANLLNPDEWYDVACTFDWDAGDVDVNVSNATAYQCDNFSMGDNDEPIAEMRLYPTSGAAGDCYFDDFDFGWTNELPVVYDTFPDNSSVMFKNDFWANLTEGTGETYFRLNVTDDEFTTENYFEFWCRNVSGDYKYYNISLKYGSWTNRSCTMYVTDNLTDFLDFFDTYGVYNWGVNITDNMTGEYVNYNYTFTLADEFAPTLGIAKDEFWWGTRYTSACLSNEEYIAELIDSNIWKGTKFFFPWMGLPSLDWTPWHIIDKYIEEQKEYLELLGEIVTDCVPLCHPWNKSFMDYIWVYDRDLDPVDVNITFYYPHTDVTYYWEIDGLMPTGVEAGQTLNESFINYYEYYNYLYSGYSEFREDYIANGTGEPDLGWLTGAPVNFSLIPDFYLYDYPYNFTVTLKSGAETTSDNIIFGFGNRSEDIVNYSNMEAYVHDCDVTLPAVLTDVPWGPNVFKFTIEYTNVTLGTPPYMFDCRVGIESRNGMLTEGWGASQEIWFSSPFDINGNGTYTVTVPFPSSDDYPYLAYRFYVMIPYNVSFWVNDFSANGTCICEVGRDDFNVVETGYYYYDGVFYRYICFRFDAKKTLPMVLDELGEGWGIVFSILIIVAFLMMGFGCAYMYGVTAPAPYMVVFGGAGMVTCVAFGLLPMWLLATIIALLIVALIFRFVVNIFKGGN